MKIKERKFRVLETWEGEIIDENDNELFLKKGDILTKEQVKEIIDAEEAHLNDFEYFTEYFKEISPSEELLKNFLNELNVAEKEFYWICSKCGKINSFFANAKERTTASCSGSFCCIDQQLKMIDNIDFWNKINLEEEDD